MYALRRLETTFHTISEVKRHGGNVKLPLRENLQRCSLKAETQLQ